MEISYEGMSAKEAVALTRAICSANTGSTQPTSTNTKRDAIAAWENHCRLHLKMNGQGCDISKNEMCKHWFVMGYNAATAPVL